MVRIGTFPSQYSADRGTRTAQLIGSSQDAGTRIVLKMFLPNLSDRIVSPGGEVTQETLLLGIFFKLQVKWVFFSTNRTLPSYQSIHRQYKIP